MIKRYFFDKYLIWKSSRIQGQSILILNKRVPILIPLLLILPAVIVLVMFTIIPGIITVDQSTRVLPDARINVDLFTRGIEAYQRVANHEYFQLGIRNSILYAFISLPITMVISILISTAIAHVYRKLARGFWQTVFFLPYVTNAVAVSLSFVYLFQLDGIFNNWFGLSTNWLNTNNSSDFSAMFVILIQGVWRSLAFNILLFTTAMLSVDKTNYKAASVDGASPRKQFFTITLPSIQRTTNLLITLGIIGAIKVFPLALFDNNTGSAQLNGGATMMVYITDRLRASDFPASSAASIIMFAIGIAFTIVLRGGYGQVLKFAGYRKEKNVHNKIKDWKKIKQN
ncbi:multiple sugar transport system permease protein [Mycoplasma testudineum]|uniref:Multiple sugar transport system permease protein n=1 Tax=Mycoplasma testudineum TaxID=244584 RepID=A0A4R6IE28_9MOLU|nr:sugar ABC transporter permease [Mycoplasma testudineum]OYD26741.1 ABC transporter permease [Mycoplasma testudineum]TDO19877.1 multiple sugar transport system permease protein [Mycoplasma testudineum]